NRSFLPVLRIRQTIISPPCLSARGPSLPEPVVGPWASSAAGPRAAVSCARPCGRGESLPPSPGPSSRRVSHNGGEVSSHGKRLRAAASFSGPSAPGRHCCHGRKPARALLFNAADGLGGERVRRRSPAKSSISFPDLPYGPPLRRK